MFVQPTDKTLLPCHYYGIIKFPPMANLRFETIIIGTFILQYIPSMENEGALSSGTTAISLAQ